MEVPIIISDENNKSEIQAEKIKKQTHHRYVCPSDRSSCGRFRNVCVVCI